MPIPELDETYGGTILGASRDYVDPNDKKSVDQVVDRLKKLGIDGLVCVGGDGTLNGLQPIAEQLPTVLAPKTIDNDLGLNYSGEPEDYVRVGERDGRPVYEMSKSGVVYDNDRVVNYVTPGYATAGFVSALGVQRIRTTAESHRRIGIVEVMGRHSGYLALAASYGQPDFVLIPERPVDVDALTKEVIKTYNRQKNVIIVCGEGIVDKTGRELGDERTSTDPSGNRILSGAAEALRRRLIETIGDDFFISKRRAESAEAAIFTRKVGHTQRGGRPILFDRFHAALSGAHAVEMLLNGQTNAVSILKHTQGRGFEVDDVDANAFRDRWGHIHARRVHNALYDDEQMRLSHTGVKYLLPIFTGAIGHDDVEHIRQTVFDAGNLFTPYYSVNTALNKRIKFADDRSKSANAGGSPEKT
jgi:6-phosphofructokinase 1